MILGQETVLREALAREARHKASLPCCADMGATASVAEPDSPLSWVYKLGAKLAKLLETYPNQASFIDNIFQN